MKLPETVKVGPITYKVREVLDLEENGVSIFGMVRFSDEMIYIEQDLSDTQKAQTFLHELIHIIFSQIGWTNHKEGIVDATAYALLGVMLDNEILSNPLVSDIGS